MLEFRTRGNAVPFRFVGNSPQPGFVDGVHSLALRDCTRPYPIPCRMCLYLFRFTLILNWYGAFRTRISYNVGNPYRFKLFKTCARKSELSEPVPQGFCSRTCCT